MSLNRPMRTRMSGGWEGRSRQVSAIPIALEPESAPALCADQAKLFTVSRGPV